MPWVPPVFHFLPFLYCLYFRNRDPGTGNGGNCGSGGGTAVAGRTAMTGTEKARPHAGLEGDRGGQLEAARLVMEKMTAGDPAMAALVQLAELYLSRHGQTSPPAPARPRCQIVQGGDDCASCGLLCDPAGHQPALTHETYCTGCCPACNFEQPGQAELFGETKERH